MKVNQVKCWFLRRGETGVPGENLSVQSREPTKHLQGLKALRTLKIACLGCMCRLYLPSGKGTALVFVQQGAIRRWEVATNEGCSSEDD